MINFQSNPPSTRPPLIRPLCTRLPSFISRGITKIGHSASFSRSLVIWTKPPSTFVSSYLFRAAECIINSGNYTKESKSKRNCFGLNYAREKLRSFRLRRVMPELEWNGTRDRALRDTLFSETEREKSNWQVSQSAARILRRHEITLAE